MAQQAKIIDVTRSYVPVDPKSFPQTMHATTQEDHPEERIPVIPYQGWNFLPTAYGYKSFFGLNSNLDVDALTSRCDELFIIQTETLHNILVALCEDGIWTKRGNVGGAWSHDATLSIPAAGSHKAWSYCVIANVLYCYRQEAAAYYKLGTSNNWVAEAVIPSILNMAGQIGIFRAGARLGFWDSDDSVAWSSLDDLTDFAPDLSTMAGEAKFNGVVGKIVTVKSEGDGFIIYATKSVVRVVRDFQSTNLWRTDVLLANAGIAYPFEVAVGPNDSTHFALTSIGLFKISAGQLENLIPAVIDYLTKSRQPIAIKFLQGRYLFFEIMDPNLIYGEVKFTQVTIPEQTFSIQQAVNIVESYTLLDTNGLSTDNLAKLFGALQQHHDSIQIWRSTGGCFIGLGYCLDTDYPIFEDYISATILPSALTSLDSLGEAYFDFTDGQASNGVIGPDGTSYVGVLPFPLLIPSNALGDDSYVEANTQNFFSKQDQQWYAERRYYEIWLEKLKEIESIRREATIVDDGTYTVGEIIEEEYTFGPFLDLTFFGESNRIAGEFQLTEDWNGLFFHRSITNLISITVTVTTETRNV